MRNVMRIVCPPDGSANTTSNSADNCSETFYETKVINTFLICLVCICKYTDNGIYYNSVIPNSCYAMMNLGKIGSK